MGRGCSTSTDHIPAVELITLQSTSQLEGSGHGYGAGVVDMSHDALPLSMQLGDTGAAACASAVGCGGCVGTGRCPLVEARNATSVILTLLYGISITRFKSALLEGRRKWILMLMSCFLGFLED